jgi:circadian clock protein KaiC
MAHSNQIREFVLTDHGAELLDVYVGPSGLLTGSARIAQEGRDRAEALERTQRLQRKAFEIRHKRQQLEAEIEKMRAEFEIEEEGLQRDLQEMEARDSQDAIDRLEMGRVRKADLTAAAHGNGRS